MELPGRLRSIMSRAVQTIRTSDLLENMTSNRPFRGAVEAGKSDLGSLATDVLRAELRSRDNRENDPERAASLGSQDDGEVSMQSPLESGPSNPTEQDPTEENSTRDNPTEENSTRDNPTGEAPTVEAPTGEGPSIVGATPDRPESILPPLSEPPSEPDADPQDEQRTESEGSHEDPADSPAAGPPPEPPPPINVQDRLSQTLENIFQKKQAKDPLLQALLDRHAEVDLRKLAAELGEFAKDIGVRKHRD